LDLEEPLDKETDEPSEDSQEWADNYAGTPFRLASLLPPVTWLPVYVRSVAGCPTSADLGAVGNLPYSLFGDVIAGITVGVMLVPQCLAFAMLAGLPVQAGLYSSFAPLILYSLFGTIRQVQPGPTALISLLTGQTLDALGLETDAARMAGASLLALTVGGVSLLLGALRFGFIVDLMSHSVMAAFCTAAGVIIGTSQLRHLLGIDMPRKKYWWKTVYGLASHADQVDPPTAVLGLALLAVLLFLKAWKSAGSSAQRREHAIWKRLPRDSASRAFRALRMVADLSSLLAVVLGWLWGLLYRQAGVESVRTVGAVESTGFVVGLPFGELGGPGAVQTDVMAASAAIIAVVGFLETVAVGGKFAAKARYNFDANQEFIALGISNLGGAVMCGYPTTGSFTRTAVNAMLGATSPVACLISSSLVLLAVLFLLPVIALLPLASLAPIIIQGAIGVVDFRGFRVAWRASRAEFFVMSATLLVSLALTVKEGLLVGLALSVLKTIFDLANPNLAVCGQLSDKSFRDIRNFRRAALVPRVVVVRMDARLNFANTRKLKEFCLQAVKVREGRGDRIDFVIIDGKSINHVDLTGCEMLHALAEALKSKGQSLIVANLKGPASKCLASAGVPDELAKHHGHLCIDMEQALAIVKHHDHAGQKAMADLQALVHNVENATRELQQRQLGRFSLATPKSGGPPGSPKRLLPSPGSTWPSLGRSSGAPRSPGPGGAH